MRRALGRFADLEEPRRWLILEDNSDSMVQNLHSSTLASYAPRPAVAFGHVLLQMPPRCSEYDGVALPDSLPDVNFGEQRTYSWH